MRKKNETGNGVKPFARPVSASRRVSPSHSRLERAFLEFALALCAAVLFVSGCAHRHAAVRAPSATPRPSSGRLSRAEVPPAVPGQYAEEGAASWYGVPFNGHRTSNGEIYDMYQFTAAHRTLPFGAVVRVTNLRNGKQTDVRINDRGPFVANRVIDLSLAAAQAIDLVVEGTAPVRLEMLEGSNPLVGFFGVQVGAFLIEDNALKLRERLVARFSPVEIVRYDSPNGLFYRVRVGRVPNEEAARQLADQLRADDQLTTFVVRLDE